ncbi:MAG: hypothetical protein RLY86_61 [Pseudomonadota bacterium]|jgi:predicted pyridoxine 5'-phosphate oxidase superfamily flavin-nucleotide-binding protein
MGNRFMGIAFTADVQRKQAELGSRAGYARAADGPDWGDELGVTEASFIGNRDSFYMASIGQTGWPYIQHRGGPKGFVRVLDSRTIGFADFTGNRQYISIGNLSGDDRVSLFFMDYANRARLKLFGHAALVDAADTEVMARLAVPGYRARVERGMIIRIAGFDWNCPQHITPRFTVEEVMAAAGGEGRP